MKKKFIPIYVWFGVGYGVISLFMAVVNFGMLAITLLTVKGISVPSWSLAVFALLVSLICITIGYLFIKYDIGNQIVEYQNKQMNPQITQISKDVEWIKENMK
jgi:hypothetical protein